MEGTREMTADELVTDLELQSSQMEYGYAVSDWKLLSNAATMLRQQQAEIELLKKQIPDWENINKPNPFIGWEKSLVAVDSNPNSGLGGIALKKASEK